MATEVEILGHKAKIGKIAGQLQLQPWSPMDRLVVWLVFDEAVGSTLSFAVLLPAKKYKREEFLFNVRRRGEEGLKLILERAEVMARETQETDERQKALDALIAEAQSLIE